jgi:hypothetical protein
MKLRRASSAAAGVISGSSGSDLFELGIASTLSLARSHAGAGQTLEELLAAGQSGDWRGPHAAQLSSPCGDRQSSGASSSFQTAPAKLVIYRAFIEGDLQAPKHLAGVVHDLYFNPKYEEFQPRTMWSLSNAFTSAFKELEPIPQFKATAKLGAFLEATGAVTV